MGLHRPFRPRRFPVVVAGVLYVGTGFPAGHETARRAAITLNNPPVRAARGG